MLLYALRRLLYLVPVAFGVSLLVFALVHLAPGDPISAIVPADAPQEVIDKLKEYYGFDKPLPVQYFRWLAVTLTGDLGTSIGTGRPVATEVASAFGNTIILAIAATLFAFSLAVFLGTSAAYAKSRIVDRLVTLISLMGAASRLALESRAKAMVRLTRVSGTSGPADRGQSLPGRPQSGSLFGPEGCSPARQEWPQPGLQPS